jgi:hypothetical protein
VARLATQKLRRVPDLRPLTEGRGPPAVLEASWVLTDNSSPFIIKSVAAATLGFGFCLVLVFHWEIDIFIITVTSSPFDVNQGPHSYSSPLWWLILLWSELAPHTCLCIHIRNFRLRAYSFLLVFFDSHAILAFLERPIKLCLVDNQWSSGVRVAGVWIMSD